MNYKTKMYNKTVGRRVCLLPTLLKKP